MLRFFQYNIPIYQYTNIHVNLFRLDGDWSLRTLQKRKKIHTPLTLVFHFSAIVANFLPAWSQKKLCLNNVSVQKQSISFLPLYSRFISHEFLCFLIKRHFFSSAFLWPVSVLAERCRHSDDCVVTVCPSNSSHIACHQDRCTCDAVIGECPHWYWKIKTRNTLTQASKNGRKP